MPPWVVVVYGGELRGIPVRLTCPYWVSGGAAVHGFEAWVASRQLMGQLPIERPGVELVAAGV